MAYVPGTRNQASDALSRHLSGPRSPAILHLQDDVQSQSSNCHGEPSTPLESVHCSTCILQDGDGLPLALCSALSATLIGWEQLQITTTEDLMMQDLMAAIEEGPPSIQSYFNILGDLTIIDDVRCYGD